MRKLFAVLIFTALTGTVSPGAPAQDRDDHHDRDERHDNGKHNGHEQHDEDRHDNGNHKGWDKAHNPHAHWDADQDRIRPGHAYPYGRYEHVREVFVARRIDYHTRHIVLFDNSNWVVAAYDLDRCRDWEWDRDRVFVYDDDHHPGWYLLFNARLGRYVHVEFSGMP